jgi:hypothetical protein
VTRRNDSTGRAVPRATRPAPVGASLPVGPSRSLT